MNDNTRPGDKPALETVRVPVVGDIGGDDRVTFRERITEYAEIPAALLRAGGVRILDPKA